jgi:hypothetical protein
MWQMLVTLTTDFGTQDGYVGAMKGVIATLAPNAVVVDVTHDLPPFDVAAGAFALAQAARLFPPATVHVAVVDPGVGSARLAVAFAWGGQFWVGPDNGVFALAAPGAHDAVSLTAGDASPTFHGRDLFAPAAARLAAGAPLAALGAHCRTSDFRGTKGRILHIDRFGNLITDLVPRAGMSITVAGHTVGPLRRTYADVAPGDLLLYTGSAGLVEIAVREGSAAATLGVKRGEPVDEL